MSDTGHRIPPKRTDTMAWFVDDLMMKGITWDGSGKRPQHHLRVREASNVRS